MTRGTLLPSMNALSLLIPLLALQSHAPTKLQIKDMKVGTGPSVKLGDQVTVDYTGKLTNGKVFDTSIGRTPFKFIVGAGQVIKGWDQGLLGAKVGTKRTLTIPSFLGYGDQGAGADIPPKATLIFTLEVKGIQSVKETIVKTGTGAPVLGGDDVSVHYTGMFTDGKKFDSSRDHGQPMNVVVGQTPLVPGFTMGIVGMKLGEKRRIVIPPSLGYGEKGAGGVIPPNATLVFDLELVKINARHK